MQFLREAWKQPLMRAWVLLLAWLIVLNGGAAAYYHARIPRPELPPEPEPELVARVDNEQPAPKPSPQVRENGPPIRIEPAKPADLKKPDPPPAGSGGSSDVDPVEPAQIDPAPPPTPKPAPPKPVSREPIKPPSVSYDPPTPTPEPPPVSPPPVRPPEELTGRLLLLVVATEALEDNEPAIRQELGLLEERYRENLLGQSAWILTSEAPPRRWSSADPLPDPAERLDSYHFDKNFEEAFEAVQALAQHAREDERDFRVVLVWSTNRNPQEAEREKKVTPPGDREVYLGWFGRFSASPGPKRLRANFGPDYMLALGEQPQPGDLANFVGSLIRSSAPEGESDAR